MLRHHHWIWPEADSAPNTRANFFFEADVERVPPRAEAEIGCETKYWLFVNGELAVFDGGLFRESTPGNGYFDRVDLAPYLREGKNRVAVHVWYFGNGGRNNRTCEKPGLIFSCEAMGWQSDEHTPCYVDRAYYTPEQDRPAYLYGGDHTAYDARVRPFTLCPDDAPAHDAVVLGAYGDTPWGELAERPVPLLFFTARTPCAARRDGNRCTVTLPYAMHASPYIRLRALGGEVVDVRSDRYEVNGGPGDFNRYNGHRAEYVCRAGEQEFEQLDWLFGEELIFTLPDTVEILELGYRESGYDSAVTTAFSCNDPTVNRLFEKCVRTLKICMRENYMDCPDRERGQWIGDVSVQAPQVAYLLDRNGLLLLRKAISDFICLRRGDVLMGNVPGNHAGELPAQSLNAISEWGMVATYYRATGEREVLEQVFEPAVRYLMLWETDAEGVVLRRRGGWEWYDHLYNCDEEVLNVCWYYSALRFAAFMATELDDHRFDDFLNARADAIERTFPARYWQAGDYYGSGPIVDDRANAMAVLAGLCPRDRYPRMRYLLTSVFNATPYMENYILIALCEMGYKADAFRRMMARYRPLAENENSTLWEDFFHLGTRNHAWSGGPATVLLRYFAGVSEDMTVNPPADIAPLTHLVCERTDGLWERIERKA